MSEGIRPTTGRRAFACLDPERGWTLGLDGVPAVRRLGWGTHAWSVDAEGPGWVRSRSAHGAVTVYVPIRAPALLLRVEPEGQSGLPSWDGPPLPALPDPPHPPFWIALSRAGVSVRTDDLLAGSWPRALGDPDAVPERIRRERSSALENRTRLRIEGGADARRCDAAVQAALSALDGWVTLDAEGRPRAVADYGADGALWADATATELLARGLLAAGVPEDVGVWIEAGLLGEETAGRFRLWTGADQREAEEEIVTDWSAQAAPGAEGRPARHLGQASDLVRAVHSSVGIRPDAPYARVGVAPHCPPDWNAFALEHLRVGTSEMRVRYRRTDRSHRFDCEQTWGVVPLTVVLEPWLPVPTTAAAHVDGSPGEPAREPEGGGSRIRLQMPLEAPRSLEIAVEDAVDQDT
ncbi:MAG: hypothetical protein R3E10_15230 [Gemmatimonadota bacterium]